MTLVASARPAHFEDEIIRRCPAVGEEGGGSGDLEEGDRLAAIGLFAFFEQRSEPASEIRSLATRMRSWKLHQMGRGVGVNREARRRHDVAEIGNRRALAIGARDMDDGRQLRFRIAQLRQDGVHPVETEVDDFRMQLEKPRQDGVAERHVTRP